ncbi:hypothetical protein [Marinobacter sp.]|uniref:hypothetical protein n=1 Tax=Marinobacter sp. TaxID=50741 RepID=UPI00384C7AC8
MKTDIVLEDQVVRVTDGDLLLESGDLRIENGSFHLENGGLQADYVHCEVEGVDGNDVRLDPSALRFASDEEDGTRLTSAGLLSLRDVDGREAVRLSSEEAKVEIGTDGKSGSIRAGYIGMQIYREGGAGSDEPWNIEDEVDDDGVSGRVGEEDFTLGDGNGRTGRGGGGFDAGDGGRRGGVGSGGSPGDERDGSTVRSRARHAFVADDKGVRVAQKVDQYAYDVTASIDVDGTVTAKDLRLESIDSLVRTIADLQARIRALEGG